MSRRGLTVSIPLRSCFELKKYIENNNNVIKKLKLKNLEEIDLIKKVTASHKFETHGFCMLLTTSKNSFKSKPWKQGKLVIYFLLITVFSILKF